jgi:hypothetical protein
MTTIAQRIGDVALELGNRADITSGAPSRVAVWYKNSYISIAMGFNFEQLEDSVVNQMSSTFEFTFPATARAINSLVYYDQNGGVNKPKFTDIESIRKSGDFAGVSSNPLAPGRPGMYTLYDGQLLFSPPFDSGPYNLVLDTWDKPVISADVVSTVLNVPDDWLEALDYGAIMRGHAMLGEPDKALTVQRLLYGYTDPTSGKYIPGLLSNLQTRKQANAPARDYGLQPKVSRTRYT